MKSPQTRLTRLSQDSPYKGSTYSSTQNHFRFNSQTPFTPPSKTKFQTSFKSFKLQELKDPHDTYSLKNNTIRIGLATPAKSIRIDNSTPRNIFAGSTIDFDQSKKFYSTMTNMKNEGFFSRKAGDRSEDKSVEMRKTFTMFSSRDDDRAKMSPVISQIPKSPTLQLNMKEPNYFRFIVGRGNNDQVIRKVMLKRYWWKEGLNGLPHFIWHPTSSGISFGSLNCNKNVKQIANHFERHHELSTKIGLIKNLSAYCEKHKMSLFDITPTTFIIDLNDFNFRDQFDNFINFFKAYSKSPIDQNLTTSDFFGEVSSKTPKLRMPTPKISVPESKYCSPKMTDTTFTGSNVWLLKPTEYNQGRGINVFSHLRDLDYYLKCLQKGGDQQESTTKTSPFMRSKSVGVNIVKSHQFVIQKYIEKPLLIDNRKFDVRVWVLLDHEMNLYCFKEKYIRLSSEAFTLDENKVKDKFVHLTNNAVQKHGKNYCKFESGNIISFQELKSNCKKYLPTKDPNADFNNINKRIKEIIKISMNAGKERINPNDRKFCFEIFGYDFIIDVNLNVWLIEINTNPSIDESNQLLSTIIPRMIDDAFRLTIDQMFIPTEDNYKLEDARDFERQLEFPVNGYSSDENLW